MREAKKAIYCMMPTAWQGKTGEHKKLMIAQIQGQEGKMNKQSTGLFGAVALFYMRHDIICDQNSQNCAIQVKLCELWT